jgi:hypothetical protein
VNPKLAGEPELELRIPYFPPSVNKLYTRIRGGGQILSTASKAFAAAFSAHVMRKYLPEIHTFTKYHNAGPTSVFMVEYAFFFEPARVLNVTYGSKRGAKTPYARMDTANYEKLISDCLAKAIGIDDSRFFSVGTHKHVAKEAPYIEIRVKRRDTIYYGIVR